MNKTEGKKFDNGKANWSLIPFEVLEKVAEIYTFGAKKYSKNNWKKVKNYKERYFSALMRHLVAYKTGEKIDPESGFSHLVHAVWNTISLLWYEMHKSKRR